MYTRSTRSEYVREWPPDPLWCIRSRPAYGRTAQAGSEDQTPGPAFPNPPAPAGTPGRSRISRRTPKTALIQKLIQVVMAGEVVDLTAFFLQPHPAPALLHVVIFDLHSHGGAHAGEGVAHERDEGAIAETDEDRLLFLVLHRNRIQQGSHFVGRQDRALAFLHAVLGAAYRVRGVRWDHLARHEPIEEHANRGQVLLDGRLGTD